jgi:hypothetical protein
MTISESLEQAQFVVGTTGVNGTRTNTDKRGYEPFVRVCPRPISKKLNTYEDLRALLGHV